MKRSELRKSIVRPLIQSIIETTAARRGVDWRDLMSQNRESPAIADARVLAMAVCGAAGVPIRMIGKVFNRHLGTVDSARRRVVALCHDCEQARDEFIAILVTCIQPKE